MKMKEVLRQKIEEHRPRTVRLRASRAPKTRICPFIASYSTWREPSDRAQPLQQRGLLSTTQVSAADVSPRPSRRGEHPSFTVSVIALPSPI